MAEGKQRIFKKLTPKKDIENLEFYEEALDFALYDNDVKNVAITGLYGSGKSSVLESYKNRRMTNKSILKSEYMHISLADFKDELNTSNQEVNGEQSNPDIDNKTLEGKILNQLLHQINPKKIPQSIFKLKKNVAWYETFVPTVFTVLFIINIWYLWNFSNEDIQLKPFILLFIIQLGVIIYYLIRLQINKKIFRNLSIRSANIQSDIEIFKDSEESYFDKYLDDVIYLFYNSGAKVIVFEDIDRFDNNLIFAKLKEINTLVNNQKKMENKITFIYMLKDDMFLSKDRTKFFDFILPVIPFVNSSNSYDLLKEQLESQPNLSNTNEESLFELFDHYFLLKLSIYIDDMRLLLNIVNEFIIYYGRLKLLPLDVNKLFSIIVYKNVLPNDFAELQLNTGFVFQLFENKKEYISVEKDKINIRIEDLKGQIRNSENEILNSEFEVYSLYFKGKNGYINLRVNGKKQTEYSNNSEFIKDVIEAEYEIQAEERRYSNVYNINLSDEFKEIESNPGFIQRLENVQNKSKIIELQGEIKKLENKRKKLTESRLNEVITRIDIENTENKHFTGKLTKFENIKQNPYFDLLVFLITNGFLDEDYPLYITYFHEKSLTLDDQKFLKGVYDNRYFGADYVLTNLSEIYNRLENQDFLNKETLNFNLFKFILKKGNLDNRTERLKNYYEQINDSNQSGFFMALYSEEDTEIKNEMLMHLIRHTPSLFNKLIDNDSVVKNERIRLTADILNFYDKEQLSLFEEDNKILIDFIENSTSILYEDSEYSNQFKENISYLDVKFETIEFDKVEDSTLRDFILSEKLYAISFNNIFSILSLYHGEKNTQDIKHKNYTLVSAKEKSQVKEYINDNINVYFDTYLDFSEGVIRDDVKVIYSILNNVSIDENKKENYIEVLDEQKLSLSELEDDIFYTQLLMKNILVPNADNILLYFKFNENKWSEELIEFVNRNKESIEFNWPSDSNYYDENFKLLFFDHTVRKNELNNVVYKEIMGSMEDNFEEGLPSNNISGDKVKILIELDILIFTATNLNNLRSNYPELVMCFISKNLSIYLKIVKESNLYDYNELINTLDNHKDSPVNIQKEIINSIDEPITIINNDYHTYVINHILKTKLDLEDLSYLIQKYEQFNITTQSLILEKVFNNVDHIIKYKISLTEFMLKILLKNNEINLENRRLLFSRNISSIENDQLKDIFESLEIDDFIEVINENHRDYKFEVNESTSRILSDLEKRDLISSFVEVGDYYSVNSKQKKNLI